MFLLRMNGKALNTLLVSIFSLLAARLALRYIFNDLSLSDVDFWYANGPGNPASSAQGIGYVQELVARLTQTHITSFNSAVNSSIVTDPVQFPLNQSIFVDATHDTVVAMSQFSSDTVPFNGN